MNSLTNCRAQDRDPDGSRGMQYLRYLWGVGTAGAECSCRIGTWFRSGTNLEFARPALLVESSQVDLTTNSMMYIVVNN